ncbi:MAG: hypothetical protein GY731_16720, partial [Gammaproteobacteria bacterium]|nr:hypothetical protein [Gammaproteobacteria bacterium]
MVKKKIGSGAHFAHRLHFTLLERLVGLSVLFTFAVLLGLLLATDRVQEYFQEPLVIYGHLTAAHGVGKDTIVRISG